MLLSGQVSQYFFSGLTTGSIYALIAIGFSVVHNSIGIVNLVQVQFVSLGGLMTITFFMFCRIPLMLSIPFAILSVTIIGALFERVAIRTSKSKEVIILIFVTIGALIAMEGIGLLIWGPDPFVLPAFSGDEPISILRASIVPQNIWVLVITGVVVVILHIFFTRTITGKAMRAASFNRRAAALVGISVNRVVLLSFAMAGGLGAIAGIIIAPITTTSYDIGFMLGLKGFAAAILGGYGSMFGCVVGGLLLGVLEAMGAGLVSSAYKDMIAFVILLLVLFIKPSGLLGLGEVERV